jgi:glycosyltransferase involved in cell wall biosynthesis
VCLLTPEFPPFRVGGIGAYVAALAAGMGERGHAVDVVGCDIHPQSRVIRHPWGRSISVRPNALLAGSVVKATEKAVRSMVARGVPGAWRVHPYTSARREVAAALALREYVLRSARRYDVIEFANWSGESAFLPVPSVASYVARLSTSAADTCGSWVPPALERRAVRKAGLVIAHSAAMARKGEALYGCPAEKTVVIPLGLPDRPPTATPPDDVLNLLSVGRAEDRKGTDLLIAALARVLPEFPAVVFRFVGPGLPEYLAERPDLRATWEKLQATSPRRVIDAGRVSDADRDRLLAESHWLVTPSRFESFGLVVVEAMRAGTPVVYAEAGGLTDVAGASPHNVVVRPDDAADLERGLRDVCRRGPAAPLAVRAATRAVYLRQFREETMIERTLDAYRELLARTPRGGTAG